MSRSGASTITVVPPHNLAPVLLECMRFTASSGTRCTALACVRCLLRVQRQGACAASPHAKAGSNTLWDP